jgi:flagellar hook assembly protein FlgD
MGAAGNQVEPPARFALAAPRPKPVAAGSEISFSIPQDSRVSLKVFDVAGRAVRTLADGTMEAGSHAVEWDGADDSGKRVAAGIYMVQLNAPGETASRKLTVIR